MENKQFIRDRHKLLKQLFNLSNFVIKEHGSNYPLISTDEEKDRLLKTLRNIRSHLRGEFYLLRSVKGKTKEQIQQLIDQESHKLQLYHNNVDAIITRKSFFDKFLKEAFE